MGFLISFLYLCLHIAVIVFVAYAIVWVLRWCKIEIDADVYKWGQVIVAILIIIAVAIWLSGSLPISRYGL